MRTKRRPDSLLRWLTHAPGWVRINDAATAEWADDLAMIAGARGPAGIVLSKTESELDVRATAQRLPSDVPIIPLIESATGLVNIHSISAASQVVRLAFGVGDFAETPVRGRARWLWHSLVLSWPSPAARLVSQRPSMAPLSRTHPKLLFWKSI